MFAILDLAVGLVFVFLISSLIVSAANEIWLTFLKKRAKLLHEGIRELVHDRENIAKACDLFAHPLIAALSRTPAGMPTYIPRDTFVSAFLDIIAPAQPDRPRVAADVLAGIKRITIDGAEVKSLQKVIESVLNASDAASSDIQSFRTTHRGNLEELWKRLSLLTDRAAESEFADARATNGHGSEAASGAQTTSSTTSASASERTDSQAIGVEVEDPIGEEDLEGGRVGNSGIGAEKNPQCPDSDPEFNQQAINRLIGELIAALDANGVKYCISASDDNPLKNLRATLQRVHAHTGLRLTLKSLFDDARHNYEEFRARLGTWFDNSMDRVSGWYKAETQFWLFWIGLLMAVSCNVDSVHIIRDLSRNPELLKGTMQAAEEFVQKHKVVGGEATPQADRDSGVAVIKQEASAIHENLTTLRDLSLPIGWGVAERRYFKDEGGWDGSHIFGAICGWLITALAASMGAPFWFDSLNRIITIRAAGRAPEERDNGEPGRRSQDSKNNPAAGPNGH